VSPDVFPLDVGQRMRHESQICIEEYDMHLNIRGLAVRGALGGLFIAAGLMGAPAFAAHGQGNGNGQGNEPAPTTHTTNAHAKLDATPNGTANLVYDATAKTLTATYALTGLTPNASYTGGIDKGTCKTSGTQVYPPFPFTADANGRYNGSSTVNSVTSPIPHHGWYVAVNQGSTLVACGNVHGVQHEGNKGHENHGHHGKHAGQQSTTTSGTESAVAKLDATSKVGGQAHLQLKNGTLTVDMHAHGLTAGTGSTAATYPAEISQGTCSMLSSSTPVLPLTALTQNKHGDWTSTTTKSLTTLPTGPLYATIWSSDHKVLLACGKVHAGGND
jgi:hypothetical protein